jgi:hypothetical protein
LIAAVYRVFQKELYNSCKALFEAPCSLALA